MDAVILRETFAALADHHDEHADQFDKNIPHILTPELKGVSRNLSTIHTAIAHAYRACAEALATKPLDELADVVLGWMAGERFAPAPGPAGPAPFVVTAPAAN